MKPKTDKKQEGWLSPTERVRQFLQFRLMHVKMDVHIPLFSVHLTGNEN